MSVKNLKQDECAYIAAIGGYLGLQEADDTHNDMNRNIIAEYKKEHGQCFMGLINCKDSEKESLIQGTTTCYTEYTGQKVYNFGCDFIVPCEDEGLNDLIVSWNLTKNSSLLPLIHKRIEQLDGVLLIWS